MEISRSAYPRRGYSLGYKAKYGMYDLIQILCILLRPIAKEAKKRLAVVSENQPDLKAGAVLVESLFVAHLLEQALKVLT